MAADIFEFWSQIRPAEHVHPADKEVFQRVKHAFEDKALPGCFMGPLRTAPIVLLYLSPGLSPEDLTDAQSEAGRTRHMESRTGYALLPSDSDYKPAWEWWTSRTKRFGDWHTLRDKIAVLNIGAYHSKSFIDQPLLAALPSSRVSIDWAQTVLFPAAERGERVVVCLRSAKYWGLMPGERYKGMLFAPKVTRSGHMEDTPIRNEVIATVKLMLADRNTVTSR